MKKKIIWLVLLWNLTSAFANIDKWTTVPVLESEISSSEKGQSKSELLCSIEASQKDKELWCFHEDECLLMDLKKTESWNDSLLWNDPTVVPCKTKYQNVCILNNEIQQVGNKLTVNDKCDVCEPCRKPRS